MLYNEKMIRLIQTSFDHKIPSPMNKIPIYFRILNYAHTHNLNQLRSAKKIIQISWPPSNKMNHHRWFSEHYGEWQEANNHWYETNDAHQTINNNMLPIFGWFLSWKLWKYSTQFSQRFNFFSNMSIEHVKERRAREK